MCLLYKYVVLLSKSYLLINEINLFSIIAHVTNETVPINTFLFVWMKIVGYTYIEFCISMNDNWLAWLMNIDSPWNSTTICVSDCWIYQLHQQQYRDNQNIAIVGDDVSLSNVGCVYMLTNRYDFIYKL